jgi:hypothetical protein
MTWTAPETERIWVRGAMGEREALQAWLSFHRATLAFKLAGLTADQMKIASSEPSTLTLLGLVRHMAEVERFWFRTRFAGQDVAPLYCTDDDEDGDFYNVAAADAQADLAAFHAEIALVDDLVRDRGPDDEFATPKGTIFNLRWVYLHMIEEYARHNGHADLLRERIDGRVGD